MHQFFSQSKCLILTANCDALFLLDDNALSYFLKKHQVKESSVIIRSVKKDDYPHISHLIKTAFETAHVSDGIEQDFVGQIRTSKYHIPEFELVVDDEGKLVGHIMLSKTYVKNDHQSFEGLLLAAVSIAETYRNRGIGSVLISKTLQLATELGYKAVFVLGDPQFYERFQFEPAVRHEITYHDKYVDNLMVRQLAPDVLKPVSGKLTFVDRLQ